jgi:hypothetical protein
MYPLEPHRPRPLRRALERLWDPDLAPPRTLIVRVGSRLFRMGYRMQQGIFRGFLHTTEVPWGLNISLMTGEKMDILRTSLNRQDETIRARLEDK